MWLELFSNPQTYISLATLTLLEIVLGIDNLVFISILAERLPEADRDRMRQMGLAFAVIGRLGLLSCLSYLAKLTAPLFVVLDMGISTKDLVLLGGGVFLIAKSASEIYDKVEDDSPNQHADATKKISAVSIILQIMLMDIIFSLDSIITAVGLVNDLPVMIMAILLSIAIMMFAVNPIAHLIERHPSIKILALSFLLLIGTLLVAEGLHQHVPKGYIYFALGFSVFVEWIKIKTDTDHPSPQKPS